MRRIDFLWFSFVLFTLVSACGSRNTSATILSGISGNDIVLKFNNGYQKFSVNDLQSLTISINSAVPSNEPPLQKTFVGAKLPDILRALALHQPSEPGSAGAIATGTIVLHFKTTSVSPRTLYILNGRLIEDRAFSEVYYHPSQTLDKKWLESQ